MSAVVALSNLLDARQVWRGQALPIMEGEQPTGWPQLDAVLPTRGWPASSLSEILLPVDGIGELRLVLPTLARLTQGARPVVLIAPPYLPCAMGWRQQGVNLQRLDIVAAEEKHVLWAAEQCLRSGSCAAVLAWPLQADDRSLRRLQVAADTGRALAFVFRDRKHLANASPASLRLELATSPQHAIWVRKCRGGNAPSQPVSFDQPPRFSSSRGEGTGTCPILQSEEGRNPAASSMAHQRGSCLPDSGLHLHHARKKSGA